LLIGGEGLGRNYRNSIGRASTPYAFLELGFYGNIGMHVFDWMTPNLLRALQDFKDESLLWRFAGAKGLAALNPGRVIEQV